MNRKLKSLGVQNDGIKYNRANSNGQATHLKTLVLSLIESGHELM